MHNELTFQNTKLYSYNINYKNNALQTFVSVCKMETMFDIHFMSLISKYLLRCNRITGLFLST